ncbi:MAG: Ldh family oxidoreductase [Devosiaceae bacterium]
MSDTVRISLDDGQSLVNRAFVANGVPEATAQSVARALIAAEAEGQSGHGFSRIDDYVAQVRSGKINASTTPSVDMTSPTSVLINAHHGFAYPALDVAIERGASVASELGMASMAITHSHHCGALSVQVEKLARKGFVAVMFANAPAAIAPWGASTPLYGTNPIAFAAPRAGKAPLIIDLSLSKVARGKVMHAHKSGGSIPEGWALDPNGNPTTVPKQGLDGTMLPIGEAKGTSLALMVEIFASLMTGASMSKDVSSFFTADGQPPDVGQYLLAIRPPEGLDFSGRLESLLGLIGDMEGARLPGQRRLAALAQATAHGLDVPKHYIDSINALTISPEEHAST